MDDMLLLYISIGVFSLMVIGLVLTIREFRTNIIVPPSTKPKVAPSRDDGAARSPQLRRVG